MRHQRVLPVHRHLRRRQHNVDLEAGLTTSEILMWSAVMVVAIVAIGALLQALGTDVVGFMRGRLGL